MSPNHHIVPKHSFGGVGLLNNTNTTCYMNVVIQNLINIDQFRKVVEDIEEPEKVPKSLGHLLKDVFKKLSTSSEPVSTEELGEHILALTGGKLDYHEQQDAHEFLKVVQQNLRNSLKPDLIDDIFLGAKISSITCSKCGPESASLSLEDFMEIQLIVENKHSVEESLAEYFEPEFLNYSCEFHGQQEFFRTYKFAYYPPALFLQLVRMKYRSGSQIKINQRFTFPETIDLSNYMMSPEGPLIYNLAGVIAHNGKTLKSGHYIAFLNVAGTWWKFDDKVVTKCTSVKEVTEENFGGQEGGWNAYMLLYTVARDDEIKEQENVVTARLPADLSPTSTITPKPPPRKRKNQQGAEQQMATPNYRMIAQRFMESTAADLGLPQRLIEASTTRFHATNARPLEVEAATSLAAEVVTEIGQSLRNQFQATTAEQFMASLLEQLSVMNLGSPVPKGKSE